jgi:DNA-binding MarR family transcriptional regulator
MAADDTDQALLLGEEFAGAVVMFHEAVGRQLGLSAAERKCLGVLRRVGPVSAGYLAEYTGLSTGAITGMIDRLVRAGHVERRPNPADRRGVLVSPKPSDRRDALMAEIFGPFAEDMTGLARHFTAEQQAAISDWIHRATGVLHEHTTRLSNPAPPSNRRRSARQG